MQLRHILEVHTIDTSQKTQWHKNGHDDGQHLHDLVQTVRGDGDVTVYQIRRQLKVQTGQAAGALLLFVHIHDLANRCWRIYQNGE